jgi:serine/threonine-protein kinase RsbW
VDSVATHPLFQMTEQDETIRLEFCSAFEMLDLVQVVNDRLGQLLGIEEETLHWVSVAVREGVLNAIKHGNRNDERKRVFVEFTSRPTASPPELVVLVRDQGDGFDPAALGDPLAPANLLKSSGRGVFFMRSFMDEVGIRRHPEGGMEVRMVKRVTRPR